VASNSLVSLDSPKNNVAAELTRGTAKNTVNAMLLLRVKVGKKTAGPTSKQEESSFRLL
jgi:hypothetical protein